MKILSALFKILGAAAPVAKAVMEDVAEAARDYKELKAENEVLMKQIVDLKNKLFVSTVSAVAFGIGFIAIFTVMLIN